VSAAATDQLVRALDDALPQTQCTRCGYPDCRGYALAIANEHAPINQCPPGGAEGVARLAAITGRPALALNPANGLEAPRLLAVIDEAGCIGCTLCLKACPVDCIVGGHERDAHGHRPRLHRLRVVPAGLPGRLHRARARLGRRDRLAGLERTAGGPRTQALRLAREPAGARRRRTR
jgi:NAD-dependent dihydropyrimidine dehydrogenase PreA subunit